MSVSDKLKKPENVTNRRRLIVIIAIVIIAVVGIFWGISHQSEEETVSSAFRVDVVSPTLDSIRVSNDLTGTIKADNSATLYPQINGEILQIYVEPGDYVTAGQLICTIDNAGQNAAKVGVDGALISFNDAKTNLERMTVLYQEGAVSKQAYDSAVSAYNAATVQLESAQISYGTQNDFSNITTPISGIVESLSVTEHDIANPAMAVCTVTGSGEKNVEFSVTESLMKKINIGDEILVQKGGNKYTGVVSEINTIADPMTGMFNMKAILTDGAGLTNNTSVKVVLETIESDECLVIPLEAVYYDQGNPYVYLYEQGIAVRKDIITGSNNTEIIEVQSGLTSNDMVISTWSSLLRDGAEVKLEDEE